MSTNLANTLRIRGSRLVLEAAPVASTFRRNLEFVDPSPTGLLQGAHELWEQGRRRFELWGDEADVASLAAQLSLLHQDLQIVSESNPRPDTACIYAIFDEVLLAEALHRHISDESTAIRAPRGPRHWTNQPLFVISIPKSGTHLLLELVRAFGYHDGLVCPSNPSGGVWYSLEYSNTHTRATDFFIDSVRRNPGGNMLHPFLFSRAVFIYRNPADIAVSEAKYYHHTDRSPFAGYFANKSFNERLEMFIDDPWLLGSIRDRVAAFIPWLDFLNVIPLSFEELIGSKGGGVDATQYDLIWSMQLKLQVDGCPDDFGRTIFNPSSPTFREGQIGSFAELATRAAKKRFARLPKDFLKSYGYQNNWRNRKSVIPARAEEFRRRMLVQSNLDASEIPLLVEANYLGGNIVAYRRRYYSVPIAAGPILLDQLSETELQRLCSAESLEVLKLMVYDQSR